MNRLGIGMCALVVALGLGACDDEGAPAADGGTDRGNTDVQVADDRGAADRGMADQAGPDRGFLDAAQPDRPRGDRAAADAPPLDRATADRGKAIPDGGSCYCAPTQGWQRGSCVATTALYTCAPRCTPGVATTCPAGQTCDTCAAAPSCIGSSCVPVCVPAPSSATMTGPLRISPVSGVAGSQTRLTVEGWPFRVGALFNSVRFSRAQTTMGISVTRPCAIQALFTPAKPGLYTVEVSQYGGGPPWVLAGFFTASGGVAPPRTVQPGLPCTATSVCAQGGGYTCSCTGGRCVCR